MMHSVKSEILMNVTPYETRVALIENGLLQEVHIERPNMRGMVGNIYKGKVVRVLPGMQAAFVEIGHERAGFLHVVDMMPLTVVGDESFNLSDPAADVRKWLYEGQELLVQVVKDPVGTKGPRLTSHLSVASRYLVYMPDLQHIGVSLRLEDVEERERLQALVAGVLQSDTAKGYIIRTVASGANDQELEQDIEFLDRSWQSIQDQVACAKSPSLIYEDLPLVKRTLRDFVNYNVEKVRVDCVGAFEKLESFSGEFIPFIQDKIELYHADSPIFDMYGVEEELQKAFRRQVPLKSGGYIVIDQTEAMTTIDVNTGGFVGTRNLEETIFKTNLESAQVIARQLRLRNLGGIIIIDFIDMAEADHKEQVYTALSKALAKDSAKTQISEVSELGLVQMTRKRTQESLTQQLCESCPTCDGRGRVKSAQTVCYEVFRELLRMARIYEDAEGFMVVGAQSVVNHLMEGESHHLGEVEAAITKPIKLQVETHYIAEQFDIILI